MNKLTELFLQRRGYSPDYLSEIESPTHGNLKDVDILCSRLHAVYEAKTRIVILPDFDMDGIMSGVLGFAALAEMGFLVSLFIPTPDKYGFDADVIDRLMEEYPDTKTIITCDVGSSCFEGVNAAKFKYNLEVLVTDHHTVPKTPVKADVIVNPLRPDDPYEHKGICGAYVFYQCLQYYADTYCSVFTREQISRLRVFAGVGTISDSMPVLYENRALVRDAVSICRFVFAEGDENIVNAIPGCNVYRRAFRGLYEILHMFEDEGKISCPDNIDESFFGFYLAPMFNSVKRMNGSMELAFGSFFSAEREDCIVQLQELNERRKTMVEEYLTRLLESDQPFAPYIYICDAPSGILGLLATKIMKLYGVPVIVLKQDEDVNDPNFVLYRGSGRSPEWYPYMDKVRHNGPAGVTIEGHQLAFGIRMQDFVVPMLYAFLHKDVADVMDTLEVSDEPYDFVISTVNDGDVNIDIPLFRGFVRDIKSLKPFGKGFTEPSVLFRFRLSDGEVQIIGSNKQHLKINMPYGFNVLCWNQAAAVSQFTSKDAVVSVSGCIEENDFQGITSVVFVGEIVNVQEGDKDV